MNKISPEFLTLLAVLCLIVFLASSLLIMRQDCLDTGTIVGVEVKWTLFSGCFLEFDGQMVPEDVWQFFTFGNFQYDGVEIYK